MKDLYNLQKRKYTLKFQQNKKRQKGEVTFYALPTDGTVYRTIVAFGQASISLQHVEEWKYYELTNLKAKKPRDTRYMNSHGHRVHGHEQHEGDGNNEDPRI